MHIGQAPLEETKDRLEWVGTLDSMFTLFHALLINRTQVPANGKVGFYEKIS